MRKNDFINGLINFVPKDSINYYINILNKYKFSFFIKNPRKLKMGDFKVDLKTNNLTITINNNLHPYQFHLTFLHEFAHLKTFLKYGRGIKPHGIEWKTEFQKLIADSIERKIFNIEASSVLTDCYLRNNHFNSNCQKFDLFIKNIENPFWLSVKDIPDNTFFMLKPTYRKFKKIKKRRTRYLCEESKTKRQYLVSQNAEIFNFNFLLK